MRCTQLSPEKPLKANEAKNRNLPNSDSWLHLLLGVFLGTIGYSALISAMRIGEVSAITPFRYSRIIFGVAIGIFFLGESITLTAALGCGLIVLSSFIVLHPSGRNRHKIFS